MFHCAGVTSVRPADEARLFDVNVGGTKLVMEESLRAEVERVVYTSSAAAVGPAADGKAATETQLFTASQARHPVRELGARGGGRGDARGRARASARVREPGASASGRATSFCPPRAWCAASCWAGSRSTRTARSGSSTFATPLRGICSRTCAARWASATCSPAATSPSSASSRTWAGCPACPLPCGFRREPPRRRPRVLGAGRRAWPITPSEVRAAGKRWTYRSTKAQRVLGWRARPHEETLEATVAWHLEREHDRIDRTRRSQQIQYRVAGWRWAPPRERRAWCAVRSSARANRPSGTPGSRQII